MKSVITDKHIGIKDEGRGFSGGIRFREVRHLAKNEIKERHKKAKKDKQIKVPCYEPGDRVVLVSETYKKDRTYHLIEVLDFSENTYREYGFGYYGILLKTTDPKLLDRIGRLIRFSEQPSGAWDSSLVPAHVLEEGVKWLKAIDSL